MAQYKVQGPDGQIRILEGPDGASDEEVARVAAETFGDVKPAKPSTAGERFAQGLKDPISGGAQLLTKMLPEGVVKAGDRLNNYLAEKTGLVAPLPPGGVDQQVREEEAAYQASRAAAGGQGLDVARLGGNVLNPANLAIAARLPAAATMAGKIGLGGVAGAASGLMTPVTEGADFALEKLKQGGVGSVGGAVAPAVGNALARVISPNASTNPLNMLLKAAGVEPTVGQMLGGTARKTEESLRSVPILGSMIQKAEARAVEGLNTAAFNRALEPVGAKLPKGLQGREAVDYVGSELGKRYDALLPKMTTAMDGQFVTELQSLRNMVSNGSIAPEAAAQFEKIIQNQLLGKFRGQNPTLTGETLKDIQRDLSNLSGKFMRDPSSDKQLLGEALSEVLSSVKGMAARAHPNHAAELKAIDTGYANFKRVQRAASSLGAEEGVISPAQLQSAVKAGDRSKDKGAFARGDALMQDLSEAGKAVLGNKVPDSGTAVRVMTGAGLGGLGYAASLPITTTAALLASPLIYTQAGQNLLRALVGARPKAAQPVANALQRASIGLSPAAAQIGLGALE